MRLQRQEKSKRIVEVRCRTLVPQTRGNHLTPSVSPGHHTSDVFLWTSHWLFLKEPKQFHVSVYRWEHSLLDDVSSFLQNSFCCPCGKCARGWSDPRRLVFKTNIYRSSINWHTFGWRVREYNLDSKLNNTTHTTYANTQAVRNFCCQK